MELFFLSEAMTAEEGSDEMVVKAFVYCERRTALLLVLQRMVSPSALNATLVVKGQHATSEWWKQRKQTLPLFTLPAPPMLVLQVAPLSVDTAMFLERCKIQCVIVLSVMTVHTHCCFQYGPMWPGYFPRNQGTRW